jgi:vitamin B12 transporter
MNHPFRIAAGIAAMSCCFLIGPNAAAEEDPWSDAPIVITAGRIEQQLGEVPARITVLDRDTIERSQAPDLLELLRLEAGVDLARTGGPGGQTSVFLRGSNSNHVLVLIDGVRVAASGTGAFTWEILDPSLIERIEIVRGPRAARWGSDAIGGVIQIFTRRGPGAEASLRYGSDDDRRAAARWGSDSFSLSAMARKVDGFSSQNPRGFAFDPDDDGFRNLGAAVGGRVDLAGGTLDWRGRIASGRTEFDQGESDFDNASWRADFRGPARGPWQIQAGLGMLDDRLETATAFGVNRVDTRRWQADVLLERALAGGHVWLLGLDAWRESGESRGQWNESRSNLGLFTGLDGRIGTLGYELALRLDDDENFGTETSGNLGLNWRVADPIRLYASIGRGFRAPDFSQLYSPGFDGLFAGNPALEPERSWATELGMDWRIATGQRLGLSLFENRIDDLIDFSGPAFGAINVREARIRGLELSHDLRRGPWSSAFNLTWQDPEDRSTGLDLLRRADFKGNWVLERDFSQRARLGMELVHVGRRSDVGSVRLPSYTLVNLRAAWRWRDNLSAELRLENLDGRDIEPLFGFNAAGRTLQLQLGWSLDH